MPQQDGRVSKDLACNQQIFAQPDEPNVQTQINQSVVLYIKDTFLKDHAQISLNCFLERVLASPLLSPKNSSLYLIRDPSLEGLQDRRVHQRHTAARQPNRLTSLSFTLHPYIPALCG